jgi:hypothetical protein
LPALFASALCFAPAHAAEKPATTVPLGHANFVPTPERPIGHRGDGQGWFPGATPPIEWWDGTPVLREGLVRPPHSEWDTPPTHKAMIWEFADNKSKNILWKVPLEGWSFAQVTVVGKRLYTVLHPYWVVCHDADTGKELWKKAMTPMLAAGMEAEKAEKLRKVMDLALAMSVINMGYDAGGATFLFGWPTKHERQNPTATVAAKIATCEKFLAMVANHRGDVEATQDPKLVAALDADIQQVQNVLAETRAAASPDVVLNEIFKKKDRSYGALRKALMELYDIPLTWAWYAYVGFADASLTSDGQRLYGTMAQGQTFCYDLDGKLLWARQDNGRHNTTYYAFNRSTVVADGVVVQRPQGPDPTTKQLFCRGFEAQTGKVLWEVPVDGINSWVDIRLIALPGSDGKKVNVVVLPSQQGKDADAKGPIIIRVKDGKVLGNLPPLPKNRGPHMSWHDGVLVCYGGMDGRMPDPTSFTIRLTSPDAVTVEPHEAGKLMRGDDFFPTAFGPYILNAFADRPALINVAKVTPEYLPARFLLTATALGHHLVGRLGSGNDGQATVDSARQRADRLSMECFGMIDVSEPARARLVSERNVLGYAELPTDHIVSTYLSAWDRLHLVSGYHGLPSYFGTDMSGVVGHGDRIYIKSAAFLYCIGPAVKGTPKDDPTVVAAIRSAKSADEVAKYLESDSAQYRFEAVKKLSGSRDPQGGTAATPSAAGVEPGPPAAGLTLGHESRYGGRPEVQTALERLAKTDAYEEIRAEALRALGLESGKPGFAILRELVSKDIVIPLGDSHTYQGSGDTILTLKMLGQEADPVLISLLEDPNGQVRRNATGAAGLWPSGSTALRDTLIALANDRTSEQVARSFAIASAYALVNWPVDPAVTEMFQKCVANEKDWCHHGPAVAYLMRVLSESQKNAVLVAACKATNGGRHASALLERGALDDLRSLVSATKDRIQAGIVQSLCQTAVSVVAKPGWKAFAAEMGALALREPSKDLQALCVLVNALRSLGADAAPALPALKGLKIEDANTAKIIADTIAEIEAKVTSASEKK